jgi:aspartyl/asparaginyl-tRNA synthetase
VYCIQESFRAEKSLTRRWVNVPGELWCLS